MDNLSISNKKFLLVKNNVVINAIVVNDSEYNPGNGIEMIEIIDDNYPAWIGWTRDSDGNWIDPFAD